MQLLFRQIRSFSSLAYWIRFNWVRQFRRLIGDELIPDATLTLTLRLSFMRKKYNEHSISIKKTIEL